MALASTPSPEQTHPLPRRRQSGLLFVLCPVLTWFGFANPVLQIPVLVFCFPILLVHTAIHSRTPGQAFRKGWLISSLTFSVCLYWVVVPVRFFGGLPWIGALPCPLLLGAYLGLYPAIFSLGVHWAAPKFSWFSLGLFSSLLWILLEWLRGTALSGFPWLGLSQAFSHWPVAIQSLQYIGALGLTGLIVLCAVWLTAGFRKKTAWMAALLMLAANLGFGLWTLHQTPETHDSSFRALIIQGNIDQNRKWDPDYQQATLKTYLDLSRKGLSARRPDLILWPETAMPFYLQETSELSKQIQVFCRRNNIALLSGAPGYTRLPDGGYTLHNRAYLFDRQGNMSDHYGKQHLVPFGEYVPFAGLFPFMEKLVQGVSDFSPDAQARPLSTQNLALGVLICYEIIFEPLVHERIADQSNVLINLSNDAWFGRTSAPEQHLHQAVLRAVEQQRFIIRATNSGISAVITPRGTLQARSELFKAQIIPSGEVSALNEQTFYFQYKNTGIVAALLLFLLLLMQKAMSSRKHIPVAKNKV